MNHYYYDRRKTSQTNKTFIQITTANTQQRCSEQRNSDVGRPSSDPFKTSHSSVEIMTSVVESIGLNVKEVSGDLIETVKNARPFLRVH
jgi:hypothetical protein